MYSIWRGKYCSAAPRKRKEKTILASASTYFSARTRKNMSHWLSGYILHDRKKVVLTVVVPYSERTLNGNI